MNFSPDKNDDQPSTSATANHLEKPSTNKEEEGNVKPINDDDEPKIAFKCEICSFCERCHYKGKRPPFAQKIQLLEESYVMKDPFSPPPSAQTPSKTNSEYFIVIGAHCIECDRTVCKSSECSIFYVKTYCLLCAKNHIQRFPVEVQSKIKKQLAAAGMM